MDQKLEVESYPSSMAKDVAIRGWVGNRGIGGQQMVGCGSREKTMEAKARRKQNNVQMG